MSEMENKRGFASDNNAGVHPKILEAVNAANHGHVVGYGDDPYTAQAVEDFRNVFGNDVDVYFVFNGTAANVLGLKAVANSYNSIICSEVAHMNVDECGAPEKFTGCKLLAVPSPDGKLTVEGIRAHLHGFDFEHHSQPKAVSLTQATEVGTVYSIGEIREIADFVHSYGLLLHVDGARLANAAAYLDCGLKEMTAGTGVDVLSFGGTKNGMMFGEAIVFFNKKLSQDFKYYRKQGMQLGSKMRFIAVQFSALLSGNLWHENARHSNEMAQYLAAKIRQFPQIKITQPVQSNGVFAIVPPEYIPVLKEQFFFYMWNEATSEVRWMTAFDTTKTDIDRFADLIGEVVGKDKEGS